MRGFAPLIGAKDWCAFSPVSLQKQWIWNAAAVQQMLDPMNPANVSPPNLSYMREGWVGDACNQRLASLQYSPIIETPPREALNARAIAEPAQSNLTLSPD